MKKILLTDDNNGNIVEEFKDVVDIGLLLLPKYWFDCLVSFVC